MIQEQLELLPMELSHRPVAWVEQTGIKRKRGMVRCPFERQLCPMNFTYKNAGQSLRHAHGDLQSHLWGGHNIPIIESHELAKEVLNESVR